MSRLSTSTIRTPGEAVGDVIPSGFVYDDTTPGTATENKVDNARITEYKAQHINLRSNKGTDYLGPLTMTATASGTTDIAGIAALASNRLFGVAIRETAGSTATVNIELGTQNSDPMICAFSLAANACEHVNFGPHGVVCATGVWIEKLTGTTAVTIFTRVIVDA